MTKFIFIGTIMFVFLTNVRAQNLIPNGSFEDISICPTVPSNITDSDYWFSNYPSPDFYHGCGAPYMDVPNNSTGYQDANTGNAYMGAYAWPLNEFLQVELADYLIAGHVYEASFVVNMIDNAQYAVNNLGMYLSSTNNPPATVDSEILVTPQISNASGAPITTTTDWEMISGTFIADGTELFVLIGRFGLITDANLIHSYPSSLWSLSYYIYDDVVLTDLTVLPVELTDFTGEVNDGKVTLNWTTSTETNSDLFVIERSPDGLSYEDIGAIEAQGNSLEHHDYSFTDDKVDSRRVYYRLRQVDLNGSGEVYGPVAFDVGLAVDISISPNPSSTSCRIQCKMPSGSARIQLLSSSGVLVQEIDITSGEVRLETASLANGLYHVLVRQNGQVLAAEKLIIAQ